MKITYESATMQFSIEVVGNQLGLTLYKQPDKIQRGHRVPYEVAGVTFKSSQLLQITHLFDKDDPTVFILGEGGRNSHVYRCDTATEALSGGSRLYRGLVALDKQFVGELDGAWVSIPT